ncbi:hypothetical protein V8D89_008216 [Ganoderma adspersum]
MLTPRFSPLGHGMMHPLPCDAPAPPPGLTLISPGASQRGGWAAAPGVWWQENPAIRAGRRRTEEEGNPRNLEESEERRISGEEAKRGVPRGAKTMNEEEGEGRSTSRKRKRKRAHTARARDSTHHHDGGGGGLDTEHEGSAPGPQDVGDRSFVRVASFSSLPPSHDIPHLYRTTPLPTRQQVLIIAPRAYLFSRSTSISTTTYGLSSLSLSLLRLPRKLHCLYHTSSVRPACPRGLKITGHDCLQVSGFNIQRPPPVLRSTPM